MHLPWLKCRMLPQSVIQPTQQHYSEQQPTTCNATAAPGNMQTNEGPVYRFELKPEVTEPIKPQLQQPQPQPND